MLTLFRMSTMEDWTDVMYINMFGCIQYGYIGGSYCHDPEHCSMDQLCGPDGQTSVGYGMATAIFFCVFVALAGLVVMSLFVGVITTASECGRFVPLSLLHTNTHTHHTHFGTF